MTNAVIAEPIPPLAHAAGGSLGSALALFLLYPLERVRIEMQSAAASRQQQISRIHNQLNLEDSSVGRGGGSFPHMDEEFLDSREEEGSILSSYSSNSWTTAGSDEEVTDTPTSVSTQSEKVSLVSCLHNLLECGDLYKGVGPVVATLTTSNFIFFYFHEWMKRIVVKQNKKHGSSWTLLASSLAGIMNVLITNPLWVANLRIVAGNASSESLFAELHHIARAEGLASLWKGTVTSMMLVSNPVIQFFCYEQLKMARLAGKNSGDGTSLSPTEAFMTGALAKGIATVLTYPLQLTQSVLRLQQRSEDCDETTKGTWDCMVRIYKRDGLEGLFTGMRAKLLQTVLTAAFTFLTYEQILRAVRAAHIAVRQKTMR